MCCDEVFWTPTMTNTFLFCQWLQAHILLLKYCFLMRNTWASQHVVDCCIRVCLKRHTHPSPHLFSQLYGWWSHRTGGPCFRLFPVNGQSHDLAAVVHPGPQMHAERLSSWQDCVSLRYLFSCMFLLFKKTFVIFSLILFFHLQHCCLSSKQVKQKADFLWRNSLQLQL